MRKSWSSKDGGKGHLGQEDQDMQGDSGEQEHKVFQEVKMSHGSG